MNEKKFKSQTEIEDLIAYVRWYGGYKSDNEAIQWLDTNTPLWRTQKNRD